MFLLYPHPTKRGVEMKEIKIKTTNPIEADKILQNFGILMEGGGKNNEKSYIKDKNNNFNARCFGDLEFAKFAIKNQGYNFIEIINYPPPIG